MPFRSRRRTNLIATPIEGIPSHYAVLSPTLAMDTTRPAARSRAHWRMISR